MNRLKLSLWFVCIGAWSLISPKLGCKIMGDYLKAETIRRRAVKEVV